MDLFSIGGALCVASGLLMFWLLFKCIDWFDKI